MEHIWNARAEGLELLLASFNSSLPWRMEQNENWGKNFITVGSWESFGVLAGNCASQGEQNPPRRSCETAPVNCVSPVVNMVVPTSNVICPLRHTMELFSSWSLRKFEKIRDERR